MAIDVPVPRGSPENSVKSTLTSVYPHHAKMAPPVLMLYVLLHFRNFKLFFFLPFSAILNQSGVGNRIICKPFFNPYAAGG